MKKIIMAVLTSALAVSVLAGCGANSAGNADDKVIKIGASVTPHAEILNVAKEVLAEEGYDLQITEFNEYVQPNVAVENGNLDANYFQHQPYLTDFNKENNTHLVSIGAIHYEPFGIYAGKAKSLDEIKDGSKIAIPNDGTNEARALFLLQDLGFIKLKDGTGFTATKLDIAENRLNLDIQEIEAAQLARSLQDVDAAIINGNYAIEAKLKVSEALATEDKDSEAAKTYANILVVKEGNEETPKYQALLKALQSEKVKKFIDEKYDKAVVAMF